MHPLLEMIKSHWASGLATAGAFLMGSVAFLKSVLDIKASRDKARAERDDRAKKAGLILIPTQREVSLYSRRYVMALQSLSPVVIGLGIPLALGLGVVGLFQPGAGSPPAPAVALETPRPSPTPESGPPGLPYAALAARVAVLEKENAAQREAHEAFLRERGELTDQLARNEKTSAESLTENERLKVELANREAALESMHGEIARLTEDKKALSASANRDASSSHGSRHMYGSGSRRNPVSRSRREGYTSPHRPPRPTPAPTP